MTLSISVDYKNRISGSLHQVMNFAKDRDYAGYSKFDALNSPVLEGLFGWHSLLRLIIVQAVNRIPINLRKISGVKTSRNPKGIGNFLKLRFMGNGRTGKDSFVSSLRSPVFGLRFTVSALMSRFLLHTYIDLLNYSVEIQPLRL